MKRELEALLFATDAPLSTARLRKLFGDSSGQEIREAVLELQRDYDRAEHAFAVVEFGGGWQIATRAEYAPLVEKLFKGKRYTRLSKAALEVLAVVSYRQPVTRLEIEDVRGVQCGSSLSTLLERGLIAVAGRADTVGHPLLYGTTREFLNHLGLKGVGQLPDLPDVEGLLGDREGLKAFARSIGSEVSEEEIERYGADGEDEPTGPDLADEEGDEAEENAAAVGAPDETAPVAGEDEETD